MSGKEYFQILKQPDLLLLWLSQILSAVGDQLYTIAIVWIAVEAGGPAAGFVSAAGAFAGFFAGLIGGVYVDRWDRKRAMVAVDLLRAGIVAFLAFAGSFMPLNLYLLALASVLVSGLGAIFDPAMAASLPELAGGKESRLQAINALMQTNFRLARTLGPGLAAWLASFAPVHHFFSADAATFLVSAFAIFCIGRRYNWRSPCSDDRQLQVSDIYGEIKQGADLVFSHEQMRWAFAIYIGANICWTAVFLVGLPLWLKTLPASDAGTYGILIAAYGIGNVISNFVMGTVVSRKRMLFISVSQLLFAFGFMLTAIAHDLWLACFGCFFAAIGGPLGDLMLMLMMQTDIPRAHLAKVFSLRQCVMYLGGAIGLCFAPFLYQVAGVQMGIMASVLGFAGLGLIGLVKFGASESVSVLTIEPEREKELAGY